MRLKPEKWAKLVISDEHRRRGAGYAGGLGGPPTQVDGVTPM